MAETRRDKEKAEGKKKNLTVCFCVCVCLAFDLFVGLMRKSCLDHFRKKGFSKCFVLNQHDSDTKVFEGTVTS